MFPNSVLKKTVNTRLWMKRAAVRAIKTVAETALGLIPAGVTIEAVNWRVILGTAILAGLLSLFTSVAGLPEVKEETHEDQ